MADYDAHSERPVEAPEEDTIEQTIPVDPDSDEALISSAQLPAEADEGDAVEQSVPVVGDEDYPPS